MRALTRPELVLQSNVLTQISLNPSVNTSCMKIHTNRCSILQFPGTLKIDSHRLSSRLLYSFLTIFAVVEGGWEKSHLTHSHYDSARLRNIGCPAFILMNAPQLCMRLSSLINFV